MMVHCYKFHYSMIHALNIVYINNARYIMEKPFYYRMSSFIICSYVCARVGMCVVGVCELSFSVNFDNMHEV